MVFFFIKQKAAYEMRISDWSADVCSSDLRHRQRQRDHADDDAGDDVGHPVPAPVQAGASGLERGDHDAPSFNRTPRPPPVLAALSPISSTPAASNAATTLVNESTIPRTWPLLASIR